MLFQKVFATHCHFLSFQFFLRQYAFDVHGAAQSIISYYLPKTGLGILDRKKDIMQAKLPHTVLCIRTQLEFWHFLTFLCSELSGSRSGDRFKWRCNLTLLLFRQYWQTGIHDYPEKKININFLIWCLSDFVFLINICLAWR